MKKIIVGVALGLLTVGAGSTAFAGEGTGSGKGGPNGDGTPGATTVRGDSIRANSICAFSGLADGGEGEPAGPGAPPQSWGQIPKAVRDVIATQGEHPGDACNGHTGFLAGGGEEG
jgi:hypothetical protein